MPPKRSGKAKKKAAVTEVFKNGSNNDVNAPEDAEEQIVPSKRIQDKEEVPEDEPPKLIENGEDVQKESDRNGIVDDQEVNVVPKQKGGKSQDKPKDKKVAKSEEKNGAAFITETENTNTLEVIQEEILDEKSNTEEPVTTKRGRKGQPQSKLLESTNETEELPSKVEGVPKKVRGGRNVKQQSIDIDTETASAEDDKTKTIEEEPLHDENSSKKKKVKSKAEQLSETKENAPKKARGGRNVRQQSADTAATEAVDSKVDDDAEQEKLESLTEKNVPKKKGGRNARQPSVDDDAEQEKLESLTEKNVPKKKGGRNARQPSADVDTEESASKVQAGESIAEKAEDDDTLPEIQESAPKQTRSGRNARRHSEDTSPEKVNSESDEPKKETKELPEESKQIAPKKARGGRLFKQQEVDALTEIKGAPSQRGGRKRKNATADNTVKKISEETSKEETEFGIKKECRVSLLRQQSVDDLALSNMKEAEAKVKTSKGSSKTAGRGKRAASEDRGDSKPAKSLKETSSKSSKKEKIPDVTALDFSNKSTSPDGKLWNLKIASWNVNGIRAWLEKEGISYLHHEQPDILCMQETKCSEDKLPKEVNVDGYHCYWLAGDKDGYSGVGLLSKEKPLSIEYGIGIEEHDQEGRVITAEYDKFYLVGTYVPNAGRGLVRLKYREQWDVDFRGYLKKLDEKKPVVLCGDLNVAHEEIDLANPKTNKKNAGFTKEERDGFSTLLSEGFVDTFRHLYPDEKAYTFWTYMMNARAKNVGWRLDYFVISKRFTDQLCDSVIRKDVMGSDHCPVGLFLSI